MEGFLSKVPQTSTHRPQPINKPQLGEQKTTLKDVIAQMAERQLPTRQTRFRISAFLVPFLINF